MTLHGGPGNLRNRWEDAVHTVARQVSKDIPVYELNGNQGYYTVIFSYLSYLPLEMPVQP